MRRAPSLEHTPDEDVVVVVASLRVRRGGDRSAARGRCLARSGRARLHRQELPFSERRHASGDPTALPNDRHAGARCRRPDPQRRARAARLERRRVAGAGAARSASRCSGRDGPLDAAKHFLIFPDILGNGKSTKPSDGLRARFPKYGYTDMVALAAPAGHRRPRHRAAAADHRHLDGRHARLDVGRPLSRRDGRPHPDRGDADGRFRDATSCGGES